MSENQKPDFITIRGNQADVQKAVERLLKDGWRQTSLIATADSLDIIVTLQIPAATGK